MAFYHHHHHYHHCHRFYYCVCRYILVRVCTVYARGCVYIHAEAKGRCQLFPSIAFHFIFLRFILFLKYV